MLTFHTTHETLRVAERADVSIVRTTRVGRHISRHNNVQVHRIFSMPRISEYDNGSDCTRLRV